MSMIQVNECPAYHISPSDPSSSPQNALILLQEWWGLTSDMKAISHKYSTILPAFHIITPDLYHGKVAHNTDEASHLFHKLDWDGALKDVQNCVNYARKELGCQSVFVSGFCMGGALTIASAARVDGLTAGVCFYGIPNESIAAPSSVSIPLQLNFGKKDMSRGFSDPQTLHSFVEKLQHHGKSYEVHEYDAGHAFMNEGGDKYDAKAAEQGFLNSVDYILRHASAK